RRYCHSRTCSVQQRTTTTMRTRSLSSLLFFFMTVLSQLSTTQHRTSQNSAFRQPFFHFAQGSSYFATSIVLAKESLSQELKRDGSKFGSTVESGERLFQPKMARKLRQINDS